MGFRVLSEMFWWFFTYKGFRVITIKSLANGYGLTMRVRATGPRWVQVRMICMTNYLIHHTPLILMLRPLNPIKYSKS